MNVDLASACEVKPSACEVTPASPSDVPTSLNFPVRGVIHADPTFPASVVTACKVIPDAKNVVKDKVISKSASAKSLKQPVQESPLIKAMRLSPDSKSRVLNFGSTDLDSFLKGTYPGLSRQGGHHVFSTVLRNFDFERNIRIQKYCTIHILKY